MYVEIGIEVAQFLFWEYINRNCLQCVLQPQLNCLVFARKSLLDSRRKIAYDVDEGEVGEYDIGGGCLQIGQVLHPKHLPKLVPLLQRKQLV